MKVGFDFTGDGNPYWVEQSAVPSIGDTVSFEGVWYVVTELRWRPDMPDVIVFCDFKGE